MVKLFTSNFNLAKEISIELFVASCILTNVCIFHDLDKSALSSYRPIALL